MFTLNAAQKLRLANFLTALVSIIAIFQTNLTHPPYDEHTVFLWGSILTYATLLATTWKQNLSPDVSNLAGKVTFWITVAASIAGLADLLPIIHLTPESEQKARWWITVVVTIINVLSKQLFPSDRQKMNMSTMKFDRE